MPPSLKQPPIASRELLLDGDWIVTSDYHLPYYDPEMVLLLLDRSMGVENLIIAGDLLNLGSLSRFDKWAENMEASLDVEFDLARELLDFLLSKLARRLVILPGNHDRRLQRSLSYQASNETLITLLVPERYRDRVTVSDFPYAVIQTPQGAYRVTHPKSFRQNMLSVANRIALVKRQHVISAHGHRFGVGMAEDGVHVIADSGGMFDPEAVNYLYTEGDTTYGEWAQGFLVVRDGRLYPISKCIG